MSILYLDQQGAEVHRWMVPMCHPRMRQAESLPQFQNRILLFPAGYMSHLSYLSHKTLRLKAQSVSLGLGGLTDEPDVIVI